MLFDLNGREVTHIPHKRDFDTWRSRISDSDYEKAVAAIGDYVEGRDIFTSGFIPGSDWTGTPYEPLYYACNQSVTHAAFFFGLIVWITMMKHDEEWVFKPSDRDAEDPHGVTYWKRNR